MRRNVKRASQLVCITLFCRILSIPKSARTFPIGPWCVYWWERFTSGYRLELTFGQP